MISGVRWHSPAGEMAGWVVTVYSGLIPISYLAYIHCLEHINTYDPVIHISG